MKLAPISFSGLWLNKGTVNGVSNFEYRPFSGESKAQAQEFVDEYNGKTRIYYTNGASMGQKSIISAKLGKTLNISANEYSKNMPKGPS